MEKHVDNLISKDELLKILEDRFNQNIPRHPNIEWDEIVPLLENNPERITSLSYLEASNGEPDVAVINGQLVYIDFSKESPKGQLGGAIFGDRRYDTTFIYHNGADSYYASRGFRAK